MLLQEPDELPRPVLRLGHEVGVRRLAAFFLGLPPPGLLHLRRLAVLLPGLK